MVEATGEGSFEIVEAEMKIKQSFASDQSLSDGLFIERSLFFHQPLHRQFFRLHLVPIRIII